MFATCAHSLDMPSMQRRAFPLTYLAIALLETFHKYKLFKMCNQAPCVCMAFSFGVRVVGRRGRTASVKRLRYSSRCPQRLNLGLQVQIFGSRNILAVLGKIVALEDEISLMLRDLLR